jgi:hypothetical protein
MQTEFRTVLLFVTSLLHTAALADDVAISVTNDDRVTVVPSSSSVKRPLPKRSSNWQLSRPVAAMAYSGESNAALADLNFQDPGAFARVSKLRQLSLLTLAEVGPARLFLGVNEKGLFGLHLGALPSLGSDRCLELARLPYLENSRHDLDAR